MGLEELTFTKDGALVRACDKAKVDVVPVGIPVIIADPPGARQLTTNGLLANAPEGATAYVSSGRYNVDELKPGSAVPFELHRMRGGTYPTAVLAVQYYKQANEG